MNDIKFQELLSELAIANVRYKNLLTKAEDELERRFGEHPSDIDNDEWIDTFHQGCGSMTVHQAEESMKFHLKTHRKR